VAKEKTRYLKQPVAQTTSKVSGFNRILSSRITLRWTESWTSFFQYTCSEIYFDF